MPSPTEVMMIDISDNEKSSTVENRGFFWPYYFLSKVRKEDLTGFKKYFLLNEENMSTMKWCNKLYVFSIV